MKQITSIFKNRSFIKIFMLGILLIPATLLLTPINITTDMFALLPKEEQNPIKAKAFELFSQEAAQKIIILFANEDKNAAYETARDFYQRNQAQEFMQNASFYIATNNNWDSYFGYRYHLLSKKDEKLLSENNGQQLQQQALRSIYSPMGSALNRGPDQDPFMLFNNFFMELPFIHTSLFPYNNVLMAEYEGKYYAMMTLNLPKGTAFSVGSSNLIPELNSSLDKIKELHKGSATILSGVAIHSYYSSSSSKAELGIIGNVSLFFTVLLIYFSFKSGRELFLSLFSMGLGCAIAFTVSHYVFGEIHLLTLIFGTSLIGVAIDYSFPFFCEFLDKKNIPTNYGAIKDICPGLTMGLLTSIMGYSALAFTPFPALQQIACFSIVGLVVAYLIVVILYPAIYKPVIHKEKNFLVKYAERFFSIFDRIADFRTSVVIFSVLVAIAIAGICKLQVNDDIKILYSPKKELLDNEILSRKIMGQNKASQFFLITADSEQDLLEKEEAFSHNLDRLISDGDLSSYTAISQVIPSIKKQEANYNLIKENLITPYLGKQAQELGLTGKSLTQVTQDFSAAQNQYIDIKAISGNPSLEMLKALYLGKVGGYYASVILLDNVTNLTAMQKIENNADGIYFMDKVSDISNIFSKYRYIAIKMLAAAYLVIYIFLYCRYGMIRSLLVFFPPVLAGSLSLAIISFAGYPINLFNILALFLILAFGIDYTAFYAESQERKITTSIAILLSFVTNILSFGLLALSKFPVIHSFGIVMFIGMVLSYLLSPLVTLIPQTNNKR